jgi:Mn-dependent DtxR family transcriptional regulator
LTDRRIPAACFKPKTVFNPGVMSAHTTPSQSAEDYLERIHELIEAKGYARVVDIASSLKVRQASVTSMVQKLDRAGFLKYEKYRGLLLTDQGRAVARNIQDRHATLSRFFSLFGLDAETQRADIEGIEHHLSPATLEMLADLAGFFERDPEALRAFKQSRKRGKKK